MKNSPDDFDGGRPEHIVLAIVKCLTRRNDNRLARVNAKWVDVFHVANLKSNLKLVSTNLIVKKEEKNVQEFNKTFLKKEEKGGCPCYRDTVVKSVPHDFVFDLFPAFEGLVDYDLGRVGKSFLGQGP